jgi:hypothetical protein
VWACGRVGFAFSGEAEIQDSLAVPVTCVVKISGVKTLVSTRHRCWSRRNKSCEVRKVAAAIYAAKPVSSQSLGFLRGFWVLSSSLYVGCKKLLWSGTWSVWLTI